MFKKVTDKPYYTNNHSCFLLSAHLVLVTKYRKPVLQGAVKEYVYSLIREMNGEPDHIHILFDYAPDIKLTELINKMKSRTARLARRDYPTDVSEYYWDPVFWTNSYFVGSVGTNTAEMVQEYIKTQ
jgi:putative transposase